MKNLLSRCGKGLTATVMTALLLAVVVLLADWASIALTKHSGRIAAIWLTNGIVTTVLLRTPTRRWWLVLASSFLGNMTADLLGGDAPFQALMLSSINAIEALIVAFPLRYFKLDHNIRSARAVTTLLFLALGPATLVSAFLATLVLSGSDLSGFGTRFGEWYAADALGLVLVVPIGVFLRVQEFQALFHAANRKDALKGLAPTVIILGVIIASPPLALNYLLIPAILFLAFRSDYTGAVLGMTLVGAALLTALLCGVHVGLQDVAVPRERILWLQLFLVVLNVTALIASAQLRQRRLLEARLETMRADFARAGRLNELGQMSASIAHELNQPLAAMLNYANAAKRHVVNADPASLEKATDAISRASDQASRAGEIIRRMRAFTEKRELNRTPEAIDTIIGDALAVGLIVAQAEGVTTRLNLAPGAPAVFADRVQIQQVLVNLLRNAVEAMAGSPKRELTVSTIAIADGAIEVAVRDTGSGIPIELADKLFMPFITNKPNGMGIGLLISQSIVEAHGGRIQFQSNLGGGTTFRFRLPAAPNTLGSRAA